MLNTKLVIDLDKPERKEIRQRGQFMQTVREENRKNDILETAFVQSTEENPYIRKVHSCIDLCSVIREDERKRYNDKRHREQLRESHHRLKLLEDQIRAAYVRKAVEAQIFEHKALIDKKAMRKHYKTVAIEAARFNFEELVKRREDADRAKKEAFKTGILEQIAMSKVKQMKKYESVLEEKKMMDDAVQRFHDEQEKEQLMAFQKKMNAKAQMEEFKRAQDEWKRSQSQATEEENVRIEGVLRKRELERQIVEKEKRARKLHQEQISQEIGKQIHAIEIEKAKSRDLLAELLVDERQAKEDMQARKEMERNARERDATRLQMELYHKEKERRKLEQHRIDEEFRKEEMRLLAEHDKLHQLSDEKRRRKQMEHRRALQDALDQQKRRKAELMNDSLRIQISDVQATARSEQVIEEERIRLLTEHASVVMKYFPPGVLRDSERKLLSTRTKQN